MKAKPDCIACAFRQAHNTARLVTDDDALLFEVARRVANQVAAVEAAGISPAVLSQPVYRIIADITGCADPYVDAKRESNAIALSIRDDIRARITSSHDPLSTALHAAVAGNIIDLGIGHEFDIQADVVKILEHTFAIDDTEPLRAELAARPRILYLGDNAGEIVFDALLVEQLLKAGASVTFTVKSGPIINDAMMADAEQVGMTDLVPVIETGGADIGVDFTNVSAAFRDAMATADLVIAKGHGNFETCDDRPENFYFLLKAKCPIVADQLGVDLGSIVLKHAPSIG